MPAVDYNYDYYEYRNGRKLNKADNNKRATTREASSASLPRKTRQSTKEQVRLATYEKPKRTATKRKNTDLDIPTMRSNRAGSSINKTTQKKTLQKPVEMKLKKPELSKAQKKKAREKMMSRVKNGIYLAIGFAIAFFICYRYSLIDEKFNDLESTKKELATAQTVNEQIQADIDSQTDLSYIENYAKYQLGMQKPSNSQIVYVNVEKEDRILTPVTIEEDSSKTWFEQLYDEIAKLFE